MNRDFLAIYNHFIILYIYHILHFRLSRERDNTNRVIKSLSTQSNIIADTLQKQTQRRKGNTYNLSIWIIICVSLVKKTLTLLLIIIIILF